MPRIRLPFYYGWIVIAIAFVTMAISVNARSIFSLLFPSLVEEMGWDRATIAAAFSMGFLTSVVSAPLIGLMIDTFGPRRVIPVAALLVTLGLLMTTQVTAPWELYLSYGLLVVSAGTAMSYMGHGAFLYRWFVRRRGLATGTAYAGVGLGAIVLFPWLQSFIDGPGWRHACVAMAALLVCVVIPLNLVAQRGSPEDVGANADGDGPRQNTNAPDANIVDHEWTRIEWTVPRAIRTGRFWWIFMAQSSALFVWYALLVHQTNHLLDIGFSTETAALGLGLVPFAGVFGQIAVGHFSDRVGREWGWTACCVGFIAAYGALIAMDDSSDAWLFYLMVVAQGGLGYGLASLTSAVPAEIFGGGRHFGAIYGVLSMSAAVGPSLGPFVTGKVFDTYGTYDPAFYAGIGACVLSIVCIWMAGPGRVRAVAGRIKPRPASLDIAVRRAIERSP